MINIDIKKLKLVLLSTLLCGFFAHAYCYFNLSFSHDSAIVNQQYDWNWQTSIGRWCQPFYCLFRGNIYNPFLVGTLSLIYLALTCYLLILIFNINNVVKVFFICGVLATNSMLTYANATYIYLSDIYMLALLCAVAGVYVYHHYKYGYILAIILFAISLGLYQSFLQVAILIFMFLVINDLLENKEIISVIEKGLKYITSLVFGTALYFIGYKVSLTVKGLSSVESYNSVSGVLELNGYKNIISLITGAYKYFFRYCMKPSIYSEKVIVAITMVLFLYIIYVLGYIIIRQKICYANVILLLLCCILLPLGGNIVYVLAKGEEHELMIFSFFMFIVWGIILSDRKQKIKSGECGSSGRNDKVDTIIIWGFCSLFIINSVIFANQIYIKKDLEFKNTYATINRVIDRIEQTDGYIVNETPVVFIGALEKSKLAVTQEYFSYEGAGQSGRFAVTYYLTYATFLKYVMNYPINLLDYNSAKEFENDDRVKEMSAFPNRESCKMIDGTIVVKFSEPD